MEHSFRVIEGDYESLVDVLSTELAITEGERDQLAEENARQRREIAHLRRELGEESAA